MQQQNHKKPLQKKTANKAAVISNEKNKEIWMNKKVHYLLFFLLAFLLYGWTYNFDYSVDDKFILSTIYNTENTFAGFVSLFKTWFAGADYRPISFVTFWLERYIAGVPNPHISHIVNVFLFACILCKVYDFIIVSRLYADSKTLVLLAILSCFIFAIHPNHVSVVANIKARDNLLSMLFGLFAAIQLIYYFDSKKIVRVFLFIVFITLAFLSKLDAYIFIIAPLMVLFFFREIDRKKILINGAITFGLFMLAFLILGIFKTLPNKDEYIFSMGFDENPLIANYTFINKIAVTLTSLFYYLKFLVIPTGYYFFFGYNQIPLTGLFTLVNLSSFLILLILGFFSYKTYKTNRIYTFSFLFFLMSIAYALNFYTLVAGIVMDKYNFIASLGFCIALSAVFIDVSASASFKIFKNPILILIAFLFTFFTVYRTKDWKNSFTLIEKDMPHLTQSANANRMASGLYINTALDEELMPNPNKNRLDSLINIGQTYAINGLKIYDKVPDLWELLGLSYFYKKDFSNALNCFLKSKEVDSSYLSSINYIGYTYWQLNNIDSAVYYFKYVINKEPVFYYSANNLVNLYLQNNKRKELDSVMQTFQQRFPNDKWFNKRKEEIYSTGILIK